MLLRLLLCCALWRWAEGCLPMQPGELPCPSQPPNWKGHGANTTTDAFYDLVGPTKSMGDTVYKCPFKMVSSKPEDKPTDTWQIVCKPDSGFFSLIIGGKDQGMIKDGAQYACSEKLFSEPCPPVTPYESPNPYTMDDYTDAGTVIGEETKGDKIVAVCPPGSSLYDIKKTPIMAVDETTVPSCKRDSGAWQVGMLATYRCLKKKCTAPMVATNEAEYCLEVMTTCDKDEVMMTDMEITCKTSPKFLVSYQDGGTGVIKTSKKLTCDTASGKWKTDDGTVMVEKPFVNCGRDSMCTTCTAPALVDPDTIPDCKDPSKKNYCTKATIVPNEPSKCTQVKCDVGNVQIVAIDNTMSSPGGSPMCQDGKWVVGKTEQMFPKGVVCSETLSCGNCNGKLGTTGLYFSNVPYDTAVPDADGTRVGTTCTYSCTKAMGYELISETKLYESITCDALTNKAMFKPGGGDVTSPWGCAPCECPIGMDLFCPPELECKPIVQTVCMFECGTGYKARYKNTGNTVVDAPAGPITCQNGKLLTLTDYANGLECAKTKVPGDTTPPATSNCKPLKEPITQYKDPATNLPVPGDNGKLRYKDDGSGGITVECATGTLYVPKEIDGVYVGIIPTMSCSNGQWDSLMEEATCVDDKYGVPECKKQFPAPAPNLSYTVQCMPGGCKMSCIGNMKIMATEGKFDFVYCMDGSAVKSPDGILISAAVTCVP